VIGFKRFIYGYFLGHGGQVLANFLMVVLVFSEKNLVQIIKIEIFFFRQEFELPIAHFNFAGDFIFLVEATKLFGSS